MSSKKSESSSQANLTYFPTTITIDGLCGIVRQMNAGVVQNVYVLLPDARRTHSPFPSSSTTRELLAHFPRILVNMSGLNSASKRKINYVQRIKDVTYGVIFLNHDEVSFNTSTPDLTQTDSAKDQFIEMEKLFKNNPNDIRLPQTITTGGLQDNNLVARITIGKGTFSTSDRTLFFIYNGAATESDYTTRKTFAAKLQVTADINSISVGSETYELQNSGSADGNQILIENLPLFPTNLRRGEPDDDFKLIYQLKNISPQRVLYADETGPGEARPWVCALAWFPDIT